MAQNIDKSVKVFEPIIANSTYMRLVGAVSSSGRFQPRHRLPTRNEIRHVDLVQGGTLSRFTLVRRPKTKTGMYHALVKFQTERERATNCDRCPGRHSVHRLSCSANFLPRSPLVNRNALYRINTGDVFGKLNCLEVAEEDRSVALCNFTLKK